MAEVTYISRTYYSITVRLTGLQSDYDGNTRTVNWQIGTSEYNLQSQGTETLANKITQGKDFTFTRLSAGTKYYVRATVNAPGWAQSYNFDLKEVWTEDEPEPPSIDSFSAEQTQVGEKKARCRWTASNLNGATYLIEGKSASGQYYEKASGTAYSSGNTTIEFNDFGTYTLRLTITNGDGQYDVEYGSVTLESKTVDKWDWYKSNGQATAAQTQNAYSAVTGKGKVSDFSYLVWNDLCAKVKSVREAAGFPWNTKYASYNNTCMSGSNKTLTATRFNSLRYNTYDQWSPVSRGDKVYGSYFTQITTQINNWIDSL